MQRKAESAGGRRKKPECTGFALSTTLGGRMAEAVTKLVLPYFLIWCFTVEQLNKYIIEQLHIVLGRVDIMMSLNLL